LRWVCPLGGQERLWCRDSLRSGRPPQGHFPSEKFDLQFCLSCLPHRHPPIKRTIGTVVSGSCWLMLDLRQSAYCGRSGHSTSATEEHTPRHTGHVPWRSAAWRHGERSHFLPRSHRLGQHLGPGALGTDVSDRSTRGARSWQYSRPCSRLRSEPRTPAMGRVGGELSCTKIHFWRSMGTAAVRGLQGPTESLDENHVFATAKHFVHGQPRMAPMAGPSEFL